MPLFPASRDIHEQQSGVSEQIHNQDDPDTIDLHSKTTTPIHVMPTPKNMEATDALVQPTASESCRNCNACFAPNHPV